MITSTSARTRRTSPGLARYYKRAPLQDQPTLLGYLATYKEMSTEPTRAQQAPELPPRPNHNMAGTSALLEEPLALSDIDAIRPADATTPAIESRRRSASEYGFDDRPTRPRSVDFAHEPPILESTHSSSYGRGSMRSPPPTRHTPLPGASHDKGGAGLSRRVTIGDKIRGSFHLVHGAGEVVRGSMIGAIDSVTDTIAQRRRDSVRGRARDGSATAPTGIEITLNGRREWREGMEALRSPISRR